MTALGLLEALRSAGAVLSVTDGRLRCVAPGGVLPEPLLLEARARKTDLLVLLQGGERPVPPAGARLFFVDEGSGFCLPEDCYMWCWEKGPKWIYTRDYPPPAHELAMRPGLPLRCSQCAGIALRLEWQTFANNTKHLRCNCALCGGLVKFISAPPKNPDVEYRAV